MSSLDVAIKMTDPIRIAEASAVAPGFGHENLAPLFQRLVPEVLGDLGVAGVRPGIMIAWYEEPAEDGSVVLHVGFDIEDQTVSDTEHVRVEDLPSIRVASVIHRASMENIAAVYLALVGWIEDSGSRLAGRSRELYHEWDDEHPERSVTELQIPIAH